MHTGKWHAGCQALMREMHRHNRLSGVDLASHAALQSRRLQLRCATGRARASVTDRHWPMTTVSPSWQRKQGEMCAEMLVWRFSYRCDNKTSGAKQVRSGEI